MDPNRAEQLLRRRLVRVRNHQQGVARFGTRRADHFATEVSTEMLRERAFERRAGLHDEPRQAGGAQLLREGAQAVEVGAGEVRAGAP